MAGRRWTPVGEQTARVRWRRHVRVRSTPPSVARALGFFALLLPGCTQLLDIPDDPYLVTDGPFGCIESPSEPSALAAASTASTASTARVRLRACGAFDACASTVTGLVAKLCNKLDVSCMDPIVSDIADEEGVFDFEVPVGRNGFDGYLSMSSSSQPCSELPSQGGLTSSVCSLLPGCDGSPDDPSCQLPTYAPAMFFFNPPIVADAPEPIEVPMLPTVALPALVGATGASFDPTTGNLMVRALDCNGEPARGVVYVADRVEGATQLYVESDVLSSRATETDESGIGAFVGLPAGFFSVTAYDREGRELGSVGVQVAPLTITHATLLPGR